MKRRVLVVDRKTDLTSVPHIYAAGDVIGHPSLASTSLQHGRIAACHALSVHTVAESPRFPYGIYSVQSTFNYPTLAEAYKIPGLDAFNRMPIPEEYKVGMKAVPKKKTE